ncbi:GvpL/GvpF family gas vesicle protein [Actinomadura macra]|uniref:GvpL/GvpF family gas vesicle protein n=1 Tax=Actinomadura macra TaxID=46164 RepID=UPI000834ECAF|nr:GvpL/GvpF family gas vesicle protein [Actinomadura macra]
MTTPQPQGPTPQYVYGVIHAGAEIPSGITGLDDRPVTAAGDGGRCAAVISDLPAGRALGERADLVAHQRVLNTLLDAGVAVVPFRFGAALSDRAAVEKDLLAGNAERLGQVLDQLEGRVEMRVKATYVQDAVLAEIMQDEPEVAELAARLREVPADAADAVYYDRVRLGELIARAMERRREHDGQALLEAAAPGAEAFVRKTPAREEDVLDASFLVDQGRRADFERAVDKLGEAHSERVRIRLIGPLPPYDFVPEA